MIPHKLLFLATCVFFISCTSNSSDEPSSQLADEQSTNKSTFNVALKGNHAISTTPVQLIYRLYGYDSRLTDSIATLIFETVSGIDTLPTTVSLEWPLDAHHIIRPPVSSEENARFYLNLQVDLNMDGQICNGDLIQDYSLTDFFTLGSVPIETLEFFLTKLDSDTEECEGY